MSKISKLIKRNNYIEAHPGFDRVKRRYYYMYRIIEDGRPSGWRASSPEFKNRRAAREALIARCPGEKVEWINE